MTTTDDYPTNEIGQLPGVARFGGNFSYANWTPNTTLLFCNVPWGNDYRDVAYFPTDAALDSYLAAGTPGPRLTLDKATQCRMGAPVRVNLPHAEAMNYNYLRVQNGAQPVQARKSDGTVVATSSPQTLYYFVVGTEYLAPNTTAIYVQLDVWQTFGRRVQFGNCYIERGHVGIANSHAFDNNGRDYLTVPEGLDVGNEYVITKTYEQVVVDNHDSSTDMAVMVMSTTQLFGPYGDVNAPKLTMAQGSSYGNVPNGCDLYLFSSRDDFRAFMAFMADKPWVTQGIVSVTAVAYSSVVNSGVDTDALTWVDGGPLFLRLKSGTGGSVIPDVFPEFDAAPIADRRWLAQNWRDGLLPERYANLKKFLTYPYTAVELTTYSATPIVLKPECMWGDDLIVLQKAFMGAPNPRIAFIPYKYNATNGFVDVKDASGAIINDGGEMFDMMTGIFELPTFSVVNDGYLQYMAANRNAIAYAHSSADWSQQRALAGNAQSAAATGIGIDTAQRQAEIQRGAAWDNATLSTQVAGQRAVTGAVGGIVGGAASGGAAGAGAGALGALRAGADLAITANEIAQRTAIGTGANQRSAALQADAGTRINDTNRAYADYAARGDYQNAIAAINARVQDAKLIQPTTSGQLGGDAFNLSMFKWGVFAKVKTLQPAVMAAIGEYWLRYGYAVNRFGTVPSDFQVMDTFTYWKLRETYITAGPMPESFKQTIRGIFEKGVTVWSDPDNIGSVDIATNAPKTGVSL